jgi:hypothetical protein
MMESPKTITAVTFFPPWVPHRAGVAAIAKAATTAAATPRHWPAVAVLLVMDVCMFVDGQPASAASKLASYLHLCSFQETTLLFAREPYH